MLPIALALNGGVPETDAVNCIEVDPKYEREAEAEERVDGVGVCVESPLGLEMTDSVVHGLKVRQPREPVA